MKFPYEEFYYLKARGPDDKRPAEQWGGYGQHFDESGEIYTHEQVIDSSCDYWLLNAIRDKDRMNRHLLIFDLDVHKAPDAFDENRVEIPSDTPVVRSQSGGFHVYFSISQQLPGQESDFAVVDSLPFDIDIRGEFVKQHVVAPNDIPGVDGAYELVNDASLKHYFDPREAASRIVFDGEPALKYTPSGANSGIGYEREDISPPENMPKCYGAGLELRSDAPEDENLNTHKVNVLTALTGLASGYEIETVVEHFVDEYYPDSPSDADRERTRYQVAHIAEKLDSGQYDPPAVSTLQEYGILPVDEDCECGLPGHTPGHANKSRYYEYDLGSLAMSESVAGNPYEDPEVMLETCLLARQHFDELNGEKPPYRALVGVAENIGLEFEDEDEHILGESSYNVAKRVYADLQPGDV